MAPAANTRTNVNPEKVLKLDDGLRFMFRSRRFT